MLKFAVFLTAFIAFGALQPGAPRAAAAPLPTSMTITPASTKLQAIPGSTVTLDVVIGSVIDLGGIEFDVAFDDTKLTLSNVTVGPFLAGAPICWFLPPPTPLHTFACAYPGKSAAVDGSGTIAHVEFTIKVPFSGTTAMSLENCGAADAQGVLIPISECGGATLQSNQAPAVGGVSLDRLATGQGGDRAWPTLAAILGLCAVAVAVGAWMGWRRKGVARP